MLKSRFLSARLALTLSFSVVATIAHADDAPAPAFYYNTLGQPWQSTAPGLLDWENTFGYGTVKTHPGSAGASSGLFLSSIVTGITSWTDIAVMAGGNLAGADGDNAEAGGFFAFTNHLAWDLGSDNGLALYTAPAWNLDKDGIASSGLTLTASAGHEPSMGWGGDINAAINYTDQSAFAAANSPDVNDLWTWTLLASMGHANTDGRSGFSLEGFGAYAEGSLPENTDGSVPTGSAIRIGGGAGYQRNFGKNHFGLWGWALYVGAQWESADTDGNRRSNSASAVANFSIGTIGPIQAHSPL